MPRGKPIWIRPHLCLSDIARGTGIRKGHISAIFAGKNIPRVDAAVKIASFLGITVQRLMAEIEAGRHAREVSEGMANAKALRLLGKAREVSGGRNWGISAWR
jgi:transcriptional regulator with XRE-family HTH domain